MQLLTQEVIMKTLTTASTKIIAALPLLLLMATSSAHADDSQSAGWTGNVSGYLGVKTLDEDDWQEMDTQSAIGVIADFKQNSWPFSIAIDLIGSGDVHEVGALEDVGYTVENHIGVRKIFTTNSSFMPYIGGGVAIVNAGFENKAPSGTVKEDDSALGSWIGAGTYLQITQNFNLGLDIRYSKAEVTLNDIDLEAGGLHAGITAGYHW